MIAELVTPSHLTDELFEAQIKGNLEFPQMAAGVILYIGHALFSQPNPDIFGFFTATLSPDQLKHLRLMMSRAHTGRYIHVASQDFIDSEDNHLPNHQSIKVVDDARLHELWHDLQLAFGYTVLEIIEILEPGLLLMPMTGDDELVNDHVIALLQGQYGSELLPRLAEIFRVGVAALESEPIQELIEVYRDSYDFHVLRQPNAPPQPKDLQRQELKEQMSQHFLAALQRIEPAFTVERLQVVDRLFT